MLMAIAAWKGSRRWMLSAAAVLAVFSSSIFSSLLLETLEFRYPVIAAASAVRTDAIVVLGGVTRSAQSYPEVRFDLSDTAERIDEGLRLYQAGVAPALVLTSGNRLTPIPEEGDHLRRYAIETQRIPAENILHTRRLSHNTAEEAENVQELMKAYGWTTVTLVTTASHMPRAVMLFQRVGVEVVPHPVDFRSLRDPQEPFGNTLFPRAEFLNQTETALREYYGIIYYRIFRRPRG
jgi:uncharacterized SAM-binding protein YcdF (DUF218 family)